MRRIAGYRCTICGTEFPFEPELMTCPHCGEKGILDILYDYDEIGAVLEVKEIQRKRRDMLNGLELYYRAVFLHENLDLEAWQLE